MPNRKKIEVGEISGPENIRPVFVLPLRTQRPTGPDSAARRRQLSRTAPFFFAPPDVHPAHGSGSGPMCSACTCPCQQSTKNPAPF